MTGNVVRFRPADLSVDDLDAIDEQHDATVRARERRAEIRRLALSLVPAFAGGLVGHLLVLPLLQ